jgi:hypothetical protein
MCKSGFSRLRRWNIICVTTKQLFEVLLRADPQRLCYWRDILGHGDQLESKLHLMLILIWVGPVFATVLSTRDLFGILNERIQDHVWTRACRPNSIVQRLRTTYACAQAPFVLARRLDSQRATTKPCDEVCIMSRMA